MSDCTNHERQEYMEYKRLLHGLGMTVKWTTNACKMDHK